jgi:hypothetical protein|tara:strand:- start:566 stop:1135 length:570 start_codon:yes stop_codon:yes gene_type:complete
MSSNLEKYLTSFGKEVINMAKGNLKSGGKGGGNLESSLKSNVTKDGKDFVIEFSMADYGTFQDKGVKGAGGEIKSGIHEGTWGGRRYYTTWKGKRKDSPYQFGSGKGKKNGIYKGIGSFIAKKGLQPRSEGGQYMSTLGLKIAMVKVLWIKGMHGISFFQNSLRLNMKDFKENAGKAIIKDIQDQLKNI